MRTRLTLLAALTAATLPAAAAAQQAGPFGVEFGAFGGFTVFDRTLGLDHQFGGGGRLGLLIGQGRTAFQFEGEVGYTPSKAGSVSVTNIPVRIRAVYRSPLDRANTVLIGLGSVSSKYDAGDAGGGVERNTGVSGLLGYEKMVAGHLALRFDAVTDYMPKSWNEGAWWSTRFNSSARVGVSMPFRWGGVPAKPAAPPAPVVVAAAPEPDADGDKVPNLRDRCPATPAGTTVDADGCTVFKDADGDGIVDAKDTCPATPAGEKVDGAGCPLPKDADADGVLDTTDRCPGTPAGRKVDAAGCGLPIDTDGDGVADDADRCANTPARAAVDAAGCPKLFTATTKTVTLRGVNFAPARSTLTESSLEVLDDVARQLNEVPTIRIEIGGHTDARGKAVANLRLSTARANAVRNYLISQGVAPSRLVAKGYGPRVPVASNANAEGRAQNRRVELKRLD
ncbi:MAG TPA: OmpA family protein [Gemmatimonadaceae bacterium]|nr:OmpA family protein [Gemmatimonadaceae bacterium]